MAYNADMLVFGAVPSLTVMLYPAVFYVAYAIAKRFVDPTELRPMAYLIFLLVPWVTLPLDALAISQHWWSFPSESLRVFGRDSVLYAVRMGHHRRGIFFHDRAHSQDSFSRQRAIFCDDYCDAVGRGDVMILLLIGCWFR